MLTANVTVCGWFSIEADFRSALATDADVPLANVTIDYPDGQSAHECLPTADTTTSTRRLSETSTVTIDMIVAIRAGDHESTLMTRLLNDGVDYLHDMTSGMTYSLNGESYVVTFAMLTLGWASPSPPPEAKNESGLTVDAIMLIIGITILVIVVSAFVYVHLNKEGVLSEAAKPLVETSNKQRQQNINPGEPANGYGGGAVRLASVRWAKDKHGHPKQVQPLMSRV